MWVITVQYERTGQGSSVINLQTRGVLVQQAAAIAMETAVPWEQDLYIAVCIYIYI